MSLLNFFSSSVKKSTSLGPTPAAPEPPSTSKKRQSKASPKTEVKAMKEEPMKESPVKVVPQLQPEEDAEMIIEEVDHYSPPKKSPVK